MSHQFVCEDCGCFLIHSNELTLQSMKEVHTQLCVVKREKLIADQALNIPTPTTGMVQSTTQSTQTALEPLPSSGNTVASGDTTVSITGTGTNYSKAEGPIDVSFKTKRQKTGKFKGISVWGPVDPPGQLGIWGDEVCVDFDICVADGACIEACPVNVYEWLETPGHPGSEKKAFMAREKDCIFCLACENVCPPQAIKIIQKTS